MEMRFLSTQVMQKIRGKLRFYLKVSIFVNQGRFDDKNLKRSKTKNNKYC